MFESWSGRQFNTGAKGPRIKLVVRSGEENMCSTKCGSVLDVIACDDGALAPKIAQRRFESIMFLSSLFNNAQKLSGKRREYHLRGQGPEHVQGSCTCQLRNRCSSSCSLYYPCTVHVQGYVRGTTFDAIRKPVAPELHEMEADQFSGWLDPYTLPCRSSGRHR